MIMFNKKEITYLILAIVVILYANFVTNSFTLDPVYSLYPDAVNMYTLQSINDEGISQANSALSTFDNFKNIFRNALGLTYVYRLFMLIFPFIATVKILSILLCVLSTIVVYRIGRHLYTQDQALLFSGLFLIYFLSMDTFYGGQARGFGAFIFCVFLLFFLKNKFLFLPFFIPLAMFFYPYIFVSIAMTCILIIPIFDKKLIDIKKYSVFLFINILICIIFWFKVVHFMPTFEALSIFGDYKYNTFRLGIIADKSNPFHLLLYFVFNLNEHSRLYIYFTVFFIIASLIIIIINKKKSFYLPKHIWTILVASILSFFLIYPLHPVSASRQFVFSIPLFLIFFVATNLFRIIKDKFCPAVILIPAVLIFMVLHPMFNDIIDYSEYRLLYNHIEQLPADTIVAGYPKGVFIRGYPNSNLTESIPFFTKRPVFFADRLRGVFLRIYKNDQLNRRRAELINALYADSLDTIKIFIAKYKIDYFILEDFIYEKSFIDSLFASDKDTYAIIKYKSHYSNFSLLEFAKQHYDFKLKNKNYNFFIVNTKKIMQQR